MKTYILGTAIRFETVLSEAPESVAITIVSESLVKKVELATMLEENTRTFYYIYQTDMTDEPGVYTAVIEATSGSGGYVSVDTIQFEMQARY
jgi:hypothetical protein